MDDDVTSIFPETYVNIDHARSLSVQSRSDTTDPFANQLNANDSYANIGDLLSRQCALYPDRNWLIFEDEDGTTTALSYPEFADQVTRVAAVLAETLGVHHGDRVATLLGNDPRTVAIYFGAWLLGATVVPINMTESDERIGFILANSRPIALFVQCDQWDRAVGVWRDVTGEERGLVQVGGEPHDGRRHFEAMTARAATFQSTESVTLDTPALIIYTSGTTGPPKGVVLDHGNLLADSGSIADWHRFGESDRAMCVLPIHHVNGIVVTLITPLISGGSVTLCRRFRAQSFWRTLARDHCTWVSVVPTVLAFLCERHDDLSQFNLSSFRHIVCGAGPLTVDLVRRFDQAFGVRVVHGYGLSETTCYSCFLPVDLDLRTYAHWMMECGFPSIGCPISVNEMAIHDIDGNHQPPGIRGEIVVRGHNVMRCYFQRPDANRDTFAHGWFRSGDEGYYTVGTDGRSYFFITGRLKELIIRGGVNYSPFDIDEVLCAIPGVKAAMAVGFENDFYGEEIGAYVQLEENAKPDERTILSACRTKLPYAKCPKVVVFGDTFPVTSTGKYQRSRLRPLFEAWKGVQFREVL